MTPQITTTRVLKFADDAEDKTVWMKDGRPCYFNELDQNVKEQFWNKGYGLSFKPEPKPEKARPHILTGQFPHYEELKAANIHAVETVPTSMDELIAIKGIGEKGAEVILTALEIIEAG